VNAQRDWAWLALLCLLPALLPAAGQTWLEYRREAVLGGEIWRLWSGHVVHYSARHALLDGLAASILALALARAGAGWGPLPRLLLIAPILSLVLLLAVPDMAVYRGASGLGMALAGMLLRVLATERPEWRVGLVAVALALLGKMLMDALGLVPGWSSLPHGVRVAWQAHAAGLALGWLAGRPDNPLSDRVAA
jgi:rhomboid family GlyGly-CTERM serine protease